MNLFYPKTSSAQNYIHSKYLSKPQRNILGTSNESRATVSIAYHRCREAHAARIVQISKEGTLANLVDMLTKLLPDPKLIELAWKVL